MPRPDAPDPSLPLSADYRVDEVCVRFEEAWKSGTRPRLEDFLGPGGGPEYRALLGELLKLDLEYRVRAGEAPAREDYLPRFSDARNAIDAVFASRETTGGEAMNQGTGPSAGGGPRSLCPPSCPTTRCSGSWAGEAWESSTRPATSGSNAWWP
jgi:hypothetical protein